MSIISKLFGMWANGKTACSITPHALRLLSNMAAVILFAVISALLGIIVLLGLSWLLFYVLAQNGIETQNCIFILIGLYSLFFLLSVNCAFNYWKKVKHSSERIMHSSTTNDSVVSRIFTAFYNGLMDKNHPSP